MSGGSMVQTAPPVQQAPASGGQTAAGPPPLTALTPLLTPTTKLNRTQILWLVVMQAIGSAILCTAINFGIHVGVFANDNAVHLFAFPNTIAGDMAVTLLVQSMLTWVIGGTLGFGDLWRKWIPPLQPPRRGRWFGKSTKTDVVLVRDPDGLMAHQWPVKNKKRKGGDQSRYAAAPGSAGTGATTTAGSAADAQDSNAVYRRPNSNQQLLDPANSVLGKGFGFWDGLASWFVRTPDPIHAHYLYDAEVGSDKARVRAVRFAQDTQPVPVRENVIGANQASQTGTGQTTSTAASSTSSGSAARTGRGASAPRLPKEEQRLLNPGNAVSNYSVALPPPGYDEQARIASQPPVDTMAGASLTTGQDKGKTAATTTTVPPAESKAGVRDPSLPTAAGMSAANTTTTTSTSTQSHGKKGATDRKAAKQARRQREQQRIEDLSRPLRGKMRLLAVIKALIGLALRGLLCGVIFFPIFWSLGIGITAAIWGNDEGNDDNVYTRNRFPLPSLILAVYGGVLGFFQTPVLAMTLLWRGSRYAFPPVAGMQPTGAITGAAASIGAETAAIQVVEDRGRGNVGTATDATSLLNPPPAAAAQQSNLVVVSS